MTIGTIRELGAEKKTVLLRLDLNSPIDPASNLILDDKRFREHIPTIKALEGSRVVIVTHQSRPGKKDFTTLEAHAEKLEQLLGKPVTYVDSIFGKHARDAVHAMKIGDVVMLENVRFNAEENLTLKPEEAKKTHLVKKLSSMADVFVNDAFGTAHRSQPTVVGLPMAMRSAGGLLMEKEVFTLSKVFSGAPRPVCMVLGGTKVDDSIDVAKNVLDKGIADKVIVIGVVANVFLIAAGYDIGKPSTQLIAQLKYQPEIEKAKEILAKYKDRVVMPQTVAVRENNHRKEYPITKIPEDCPVLDIGIESIHDMVGVLKKSGTVVFNGPAGLFEEADFATGTYEMLKAASKVEFSVVGGGHTAVVIEKMGLDKDFTHISTGGGACIEFLTGKVLPAVDALEQSKKIFG
ncbi:MULTISPECIES: phosphoglycerate kinase [unclassified Methanoregula]|uniref:phosphoglycerate kinase n=1 Tax=unclassified Methanoregula TaxID=2649730 RepID=UPI0009C95010|nr:MULTISPECIES: phosphoglycerate kinase [unclassified Methanoregula]OPX64193.1 MAG: Phosphoglycerate kinase [Methanoregula sp. PtaB.Bin085]OPY34687.1 MAG: Phosphoglycerate kinase [Methanoregula sp. PtaU1.Bin006]